MTNYPSNLTDEQWELIKDLLPKRKSDGFKVKHDKRDIIDAILYLNKSGCQWRMLPSDFPPWKTVYSHFRSLTRSGTWAKINNEINEKVRTSYAKEPSPSLLCVDSQSVDGEVKPGREKYRRLQEN